MEYTKRIEELSAIFLPGREIQLDASKTVIRFCKFSSTNAKGDILISEDVLSDRIAENEDFWYPVIMPKGHNRSNKVILMMHGLNERNWKKYLPWAEYMCEQTGKAVVLFPIAFHINRSPAAWSDPRRLMHLFESRKSLVGNDRSLSLANVALSERITRNPLRFLNSGKQTLDDLIILLEGIKQGKHPLFQENASLDVFAYSIGAFLSQIAFLSNPHQLFSDSKLFMFCGGSVFSSMFGESRSIMDKTAFDRLLNYYKFEFKIPEEVSSEQVQSLSAFESMLSQEKNELNRTGFFQKAIDRISGISLKNDIVIPYEGVKKALGEELARQRVKLLDFSYAYTHENPFPVLGGSAKTDVDRSFLQVFQSAAGFLA